MNFIGNIDEGTFTAGISEIQSYIFCTYFLLFVSSKFQKSSDFPQNNVRISRAHFQIVFCLVFCGHRLYYTSALSSEIRENDLSNFRGLFSIIRRDIYVLPSRFSPKFVWFEFRATCDFLRVSYVFAVHLEKSRISKFHT